MQTHGPLITIENNTQPKIGDSIIIHLTDGSTRFGQIIELNGKKSVIQVISLSDYQIIKVFQGTEKLQVDNSSYEFTGTPLKLPISDQMLGHIFDVSGNPLDKGFKLTEYCELNIQGLPINPSQRVCPSEIIETRISAIDLFCPIMRGSKIALFSSLGLPHDQISAQICKQATLYPGKDINDYSDENLAIIFAGIGIPQSSAQFFKQEIEQNSALKKRTSLLLNYSNNPTLERFITAKLKKAFRLALTLAEHLAFDREMHTLVILNNINNYADSLHEIGIFSERLPGRRGYPASFYTDLAEIYERAGIIQGKNGSITLIPILTMNNDDISHPIPDITGQLTDGQIVLRRDLYSQQV